MKRIYCRACDACGLQEVLNLGKQPPSNALLTAPDQKENFFPLRLMVCRQCHLLQLDYDVSHYDLFTDKYPYFSGANPAWVKHCREYSQMISNRLKLGSDSVVVEIGGNDGTLLENFLGKVFCVLNVEPSASVAMAAVDKGIVTRVASWKHDTEIEHKADLIIANNVMAHTPDLQGFVEGVARNLNAGGTFTAEFPWALNMIEQCQFDTIYHEHYSYLALRPLLPLFAEHGLRIYDVEKLSTHGGSLRIYAAKNREVTRRVTEVMHEEDSLGKMETYFKFKERAYSIRGYLESFLQSSYGESVLAYGAAAKGSTLLNWLGYTNADIPAVGDDSPAKIGKFMPGSRIPILSQEQLLACKPDYVLILPWNWKDEIVDRLHCIRAWGGQFVTAIPELKVF